MPLGTTWGEFGTPSEPGGGGGGSGTVTNVSVVTANGFAGTVANPTTTAAITMQTTITGLLKGNGTAISAAIVGTDYIGPTSGSAIQKANGAGGLTAATPGTDYPATGVISAGGPTGSSTVVPVITWNANGQLTAVTTATIAASAAPLIPTIPLKTANYNAVASDLVLCDNTGGTFSVTLPTAPANLTVIGVKLVTLGVGNTINVAAGGSDVFDRPSGSAISILKVQSQERTYIYNSANAVWAIIDGSSQGAQAPSRITQQSTTYAALSGDIVLATAGAGGFTVTSPGVSPAGTSFIVKKVDSGAGTITISPVSGTIDGAASLTLVVQYDVAWLVSNGTNWSDMSAIVGNANLESIIRANTLDQMGAPAANLSMNSKRLINMGQGIVATDAPDLGQLAGNQYPYVVSGCVWTADAPASTLNGSMTAGTVMIKGILLTVAAVTAHGFTASKDTYIDLTDNGDGTAAITYTAVNNNTISPALVSTFYATLRIAVVVSTSSALTSTAASICQGGYGFSTATAQGSTTVAAGSNGNTIVTTPLNVASSASFPSGGGFAQVVTNHGTAVIQFTGTGTGTLTGVTVIASQSSAITVATGNAVTGFSPFSVSDMLGNPIFLARPDPGLIGGISFDGASPYTTTETANTPIPAFFFPFIIPPGPSRRVEVITSLPFVATSAVAGNTVKVSTWSGNITGTLGLGQGTMAVASDGWPMTVMGYASLAPGTYYPTITTAAGAAGTVTVGVAFALNFASVKLV